MKTDDFDYYLPNELIAQVPLEDRAESRMLVLDRDTGDKIDDKFYNIINYLNKGDVLVLNDTKVMPARLIGEKEDTGAIIEVLLLKNIDGNNWECLVKPAKRIHKDTIVSFGNGLLKAKCTGVNDEGIRNFEFIYDGIFYEILDKFEAGIVLTGTEIKSVRNGNANIKDSYAIIKNGEVFLLNMFISEYKEGNIFNHEETRTRKLLLHKNEIRKINDKIKIKGLTIVPLKVYFVRGKAKVEIGIARGKHTYDKKETIKQRDIDREMKKSLKERF